MGYRHFNDTDDNAAVFSISVPLSLFGRNQGEIEAARHELAAAQVLRRAADRDWKSNVLDKHSRLVSAVIEIDRMRDVVLPEAAESHRAVIAAFEAGRVDYLAVMDVRRTGYRLTRELIGELEAYHQSRAELEQLTTPFQEAP